MTLRQEIQQKNKEGSFRAMFDLMKRRGDYRLILLSNMISQLGDWLTYIAISLLTVSSGEGGLALAGAYLVHTLPNAILAPFSGRVADRFDRKWVMILSAFFASIMTIFMCIAASKGEIWILQALTFMRTCVSSFGITARQAAIPSLVDQDELYTANALSSIVWSTLFAVGVALGGFLSATVGPTLAIGIDSVTFLIALFIIWPLPALPPQKNPAKKNPESTHPIEAVQDLDHYESISQTVEMTPQSGLWTCWRFARRDPRLAAALLAKTPLGLINSAGWMTLTLLAALTFNDRSGAILGVFHASRALGTGVGPLVFYRIWPNSAVQSSLWASVTTLVLLLSDTLWLSVLALFFFGALLGYTWVRSSALIQVFAPSEVLGRLTAFDFSATITCQTLSILIMGGIYDLGYGLETGLMIVLSITAVLGAWLLKLERSALDYDRKIT